MSKPIAKGIIIAAVAVLLIPIESTAVTKNSKNTANRKLPLAKEITLWAIYWSSFWTLKAVAMAKPPKNKKIVGFAKASNALLVFSNPKSIANTGTKSAVIVMCKASVSHKIATKASKAKPFLVGSS